MLSTDFEYPLWESLSQVCGIDEAGRGPLAGPVVAAAVVFPRHFRPTGIFAKLDDSKKLTAELRDELALAIRESAESWALGVVDAETIDRINILQATMLAMNLAVESLGSTPEFLLVDGNRFRPVLPIPYQTIVKGDSKVFSIAAASVLAKTHRDELMTTSAAEYPEYGFEVHFGYPTARHVEAIARHGRCAIHRQSFKLRKLGEK
ncbi:MAG TPA: ribonuclease HII [Chlorobaculum sp.]|uniref:Ribonuclease HII n=1 Tax=Chlorobaculum tepidum (strain ATCC 49652 / DSM 12025 / NBRC 103806 / TLS) TaxID=194439 RepID=RNH2_CHLTE|nr:ribonuclease HII [Chlorobaculum tepidum]Q8KAA5.1 RecName: Full=Ribonuclease HII; Short=RNase HII [Chlorobaculum tepidum TLS]AAM73476.1 ribonuclease HII [Chlorobaculum tepidum TLS]HBU24231.1 ribonuclease HII [Chlorobaculum sp.]